MSFQKAHYIAVNAKGQRQGAWLGFLASAL